MNLKELRQAKNLTPGELARKLGVAEVSVRKWEYGERGIATRHLIRLARIFEVGVEDILTAGAETKLPDAKEIK